MIQQMVQFNELPHEDPNAHIAKFLETCGTFNMDRVKDDATRLCLFSFKLRDNQNHG